MKNSTKVQIQCLAQILLNRVFSFQEISNNYEQNHKIKLKIIKSVIVSNGVKENDAMMRNITKLSQMIN